jgi:hypothetical protein
MIKSDLSNIINFIKQNFPKDAADVSDSLDLLNLALDGLLNSANIKVGELNKSKNYDKSMELIEFLRYVSELQTQINEFSTMINIESEMEDEELTEESDIVEEEKNIPNYAEYAIDSSIPHTLYEDFTHKKAVAFSINNKRYEAKDWKAVLLQTCDLLSEIDANKFYEFIDDPVMKGRKNSYFGNKFIEKKNAKMKNIDIYVWTNLSANHIKNLLRKLLKKFGIKINDYYVYLRADYTPLHKNDDGHEESDSSSEDKIGKYVRITMRGLSNKQQPFSDNEITSMQSKQWSKELLGLDYPFLRQYKDGVDISLQIKDGSYGRYWKEIFEFNGKKFLVTSQWFDRNRDPFTKWIEKIKV